MVNRKLAGLVAVAACLGLAGPAKAAPPSDPVAGCAPAAGYDTQLLTVSDAAAFVYPFLLNPPSFDDFLATVAAQDRNGDGFVCAGVNPHLNPHFDAHRVRIVDNTNPGQLR